MVEWTKDALKAGVDASIESQKYPRDQLSLAEYEEAQIHIRAALDAAVKAQKQHPSGIRDITDYMDGQAEGYAEGRAEALEEAERIANAELHNLNALPTQPMQSSAAFNILTKLRALKDKPAHTDGGE